MVRAPRSALVTPGWAMVNAIARWVIGSPASLGERDELFDDVEAALVGEVVDHVGAAQVVVLVLAYAAGEQALAERAPDQGAHAEALGGGQYLALDAAVEDGVDRLLGVESREAAPLGDPLGLDDVGGVGLRRADRADLAAADQVGQCGEGLLDVGAGVGAVELVEVDVVGLQATQRVLHGGDDPAPRGALLVRVLAGRAAEHRAAELGGEHDLVPAPFQGLADDVLGVAVGVGGVDEVDAGVQRLVDDAGRVLGGIAHGCGEHQGAQGVGADLDAGPAEGAVLHGFSPCGGRHRVDAVRCAKWKLFPEVYGKLFRLCKRR